MARHACCSLTLWLLTKASAVTGLATIAVSQEDCGHSQRLEQRWQVSAICAEV